MPVPTNPIGRRQVLKALAAIPVLAGPLSVPGRPERPASADATDPAVADAGHRPPPRHRQALIGVL
ncbi:hypothetical protein ACPPVO_44465 [Dactylosporangium sp. McL0621]|uniref:hypothetical protein n=1 Tax=Dactylosporangium sp. McL0621 TaxID=3415678 RepID=UPI003CF7BF1B